MAYVEFSGADSERQIALDGTTVVDYGADGSVVGVEFISPSRGVNLAGVPRAAEIERQVRRLGPPFQRYRSFLRWLEWAPMMALDTLLGAGLMLRAWLRTLIGLRASAPG